jgi:predicted O-methyltransferase YrrM
MLGSSSLVSDSKLLTFLQASEFRPLQRRSEVLALVDLIRSSNYDSMLEIGTSTAGTSILASRALRAPANLTTVDIEARYTPDRLRKSLPSRVDVRLLVADSHQSGTVDLVRNGQERGFDVIFIDGDHSYKGVRMDTERFAPLARPGGILVFHDIQRINQSDDSSSQELYVGGVPDWWRQIRATLGGSIEEFVNDDRQSGFGIGVVLLPGSLSEIEALVTKWSALEMLE